MTAARLRSAAARLREVAEGATPGPWWADGGDVLDVASSCQVADAFAEEDHNATYIAAMSPPVALALADWLDAEADDIPPYANMYRDLPLNEAPAVRLADAVLSDREQVPP